MMDERYTPERVEEQAQTHWDEHRSFDVDEDPSREKFYCLSMFPYPSGKLHIGHVRNYAIGDVISRYQRMRGRNVLQPMGWDAFGLPAENAAITNQVPPARWTRKNIEDMKRQLRRLGFAYDWNREFATCDPDYYRWEQWLFTRLFEQGIAYRRESEVNWDPVDETVLANEQVIDGRGWRSGALVERRRIPQWFLRITDYADELLDELDNIDWPDAVKTMQRNWIGRSVGTEIDFEIADEPDLDPLRVFTTRPDTIYGTTFMAVAADHPLATKVAKSDSKVAAFIEECRHGGTSEAEIETVDKRGCDLGLRAINPFNDERIPIWVANFVLMGYGTGAIMAVPAHDERDHEFARRYGLPIRQVISPPKESDESVDIQSAAWSGKEGIVIDSGEYSGLGFDECFEAMAKWLEENNRGVRRVNYRLHDWGVSRQRYWGCPVPIIHCDTCGMVKVPDEQLPVVLPEDVDLSGGGSPLARLEAFVDTTCPTCSGPARRDTDTFDTFMESSWYFARFCCADAHTAKLDERADYWLPVDQYIGGIEHAILHLMYARFYQKLINEAGLSRVREPFSSLLTQGMVVAETFYREEEGKIRYYAPAEVDVEHDARGRSVNARTRSDGKALSIGPVEKMSKSKNNGVDPEDMVARYGADTVRLYVMETSPPDQMLEWSGSAVAGAARFLRRLWQVVRTHTEQEGSTILRFEDQAQGIDLDSLDENARFLRCRTHETITKVSDDVGRRYKFNTACAACRELLNEIATYEARCEGTGSGSPKESSDIRRAVIQEAIEAIVLMLAPVIPHICHVLWQALGHREAVIDAPWPTVDESAIVRDEIELAVQVNGKLRARIRVAADADRSTIESAATHNANVLRFIEGKDIRRVIVVPGKIVNIVV